MSKPHNWVVIEIDARTAGLDVGEFWHCFQCGASGGPVGWGLQKHQGDGKPGDYLGFFLSGTVLRDLSYDCAVAREQIDGYVKLHPEYAADVSSERDEGGFKRRSASSHVDKQVDESNRPAPLPTERQCPLCEDTMMRWGQSGPDDWCHRCRVRLQKLAFGTETDACAFRSAVASNLGIYFRK